MSENEENFKLCEESSVYVAIESAVVILEELDECFPEGDIPESAGVHIGASKLADICETLLTYAAIFDELDVDAIFEHVEEMRSCASTYKSSIKH